MHHAASTVVTPQGAGQYPSLLAFLCAQFPHISATVWQQRLTDGLVHNASGAPLGLDAPFVPQQKIHYFRHNPTEAPIPVEVRIVYEDERIVVADKPHFLPSQPTGGYVKETLQYRLQSALNLPQLVLAHRLDKDTAGLVLCVKQPQHRAAYQALFAQRRIEKTYLAVAADLPHIALNSAQTLALHIAPSAHFHVMQVQAQLPPNTLTSLCKLRLLTGAVQGLAVYELRPKTGKKHQLRVTMNHLGAAIINDGIYPVLTPEGAADFAKPLQLLAQQLRFIDPITKVQMQFDSGLQLQHAA